MEELPNILVKQPQWWEYKKTIITIATFFFLLIGFGYKISPPRDFPKGQVVTIIPGESLQEITDSLYLNHVINSPFLFRTTVIVLGGERRVIAGDYLLDKMVGPIGLAERMVRGDFHLVTVKVTIPEGWSVAQIGDYLGKNLINFNKAQFLSLARKQEGYLFPDTYFISPTSKPQMVIDRMKSTFDEKVLTIRAIATSTYPLKDIIIMSSIVENEARTTESRKIIAGILWKRLTLGMPLQVDSTLTYVTGRNTFDLTSSDLKMNSPYNTYLYKGLPPTPIGNPGLDAIYSTLNPTKTKFLYYLSDKKGTMHYATTFDEHIQNEKLYLQ